MNCKLSHITSLNKYKLLPNDLMSAGEYTLPIEFAGYPPRPPFIPTHKNLSGNCVALNIIEQPIDNGATSLVYSIEVCCSVASVTTFSVISSVTFTVFLEIFLYIS